MAARCREAYGRAVNEDSVGARLRAARKALGLSQNQLHARSGIPKSRLSRYENGWRVPSVSTLVALAEALKCGVGDLVMVPSQAGDHLDDFTARLRQLGVRFRSAEDARGAAASVASTLRGGVANPPV